MHLASQPYPFENPPYPLALTEERLHISSVLTTPFTTGLLENVLYPLTQIEERVNINSMITTSLTSAALDALSPITLMQGRLEDFSPLLTKPLTSLVLDSAVSPLAQMDELLSIGSTMMALLTSGGAADAFSPITLMQERLGDISSLPTKPFTSLILDSAISPLAQMDELLSIGSTMTELLTSGGAADAFSPITLMQERIGDISSLLTKPFTSLILDSAVNPLAQVEEHLNINSAITTLLPPSLFNSALSPNWTSSLGAIVSEENTPLPTINLQPPLTVEVRATRPWHVDGGGQDNPDSQLQLLLLPLGSEIQDIHRGAWEALTFGEADALRQAAHSARELVDWVLRSLAPESAFSDEDVRREGADGRATRRMKVRHAARRRDTAIIDALCELVVNLQKSLSAVAHRGYGTRVRLRGLLRASESLLLLLLDGDGEARSDVQKLTDDLGLPRNDLYN